MIDSKIKKIYHCTLKKNYNSILLNGIVAGPDGGVYFAPTPNDAAKFLVIRSIPPEEIVAFEVLVKRLDKTRLDYSADHSFTHFGCDAYVYYGNIPITAVTQVFNFERN